MSSLKSLMPIHILDQRRSATVSLRQSLSHSVHSEMQKNRPFLSTPTVPTTILTTIITFIYWMGLKATEVAMTIDMSSLSLLCVLYVLFWIGVPPVAMHLLVVLRLFMAKQPSPSIALPAARWTPISRRHVGTARLLYAFSGWGRMIIKCIDTTYRIK